MAVEVFFDTSVLLAGLIDLGPQSGPAQSVLNALAGDGLALLPRVLLRRYQIAAGVPVAS